jgi:peptidoglycan-N-acetylglucosamine deacetylase
VTRWALALLVVAAIPLQAQRRVAFTFDDLPGSYVPDCDPDALRRLNEQLVSAIRRNHMPAIGFVNEGHLCPEKHEALPSLLNLWLDAGLDLGNHTYSHIDFNSVSLDAFEKDLIAGEKTTKSLLASRGRKLQYFRFPMLHMGKDLQKKRAIEEFLHKRGYENAVVSIDDDDYIYAVVYARADAATKRRLADDYIRYMESIFAFYEKLSMDTLGYEPPQVLLLHDHQLNADTLDRLAALARKRGYSFVSIGEALRDPVYQRRDRYAGGVGLSWMHRWALDAGKKPPDQPEVPAWVMHLFQGERAPRPDS